MVSKTEVSEHIYGYDEDRDSNTIEVLINRLRRKLAPELIRTYRGQGYQLLDPNHAPQNAAPADRRVGDPDRGHALRRRAAPAAAVPGSHRAPLRCRTRGPSAGAGRGERGSGSGTLQLSWQPFDPRFNRPQSGWYWQIEQGDAIVERSQSL